MTKKQKNLINKMIRMKQWYSSNRGQTVLEYSIFAMILVAAFFIGGVYVKRSIQGRWKTAVDDFGDPYDPRSTNGSVTYSTKTDSNSIVRIVPDFDGWWTQRIDTTNTTESKTGTIFN